MNGMDLDRYLWIHCSFMVSSYPRRKPGEDAGQWVGTGDTCTFLWDTVLHFVLTGPLPELLVGNQETLIISQGSGSPVALKA